MGLPQREDKGAGITVQGKGKGSGSAAVNIYYIYYKKIYYTKALIIIVLFSICLCIIKTRSYIKLILYKTLQNIERRNNAMQKWNRWNEWLISMSGEMRE